MNTDYCGRRATIMGLGRFGGGIGAARWLVHQGAIVTVSDAAGPNELAESLSLLADVPPAAVHLGGHRSEDFTLADLVVVNPAVHPDNPWLQIARRSGARLCTEIELFIERCPAKIIGITGTNGKSTTAAMIASILESAGRHTFLGGNIGGSLLEQLPEIRADDWVVLELSSFQLHHLSPETQMPYLAVVTGCRPNHLDWHGSYQAYESAKQRILTGQKSDDMAVFNPLATELASWSRLIRGRQLTPKKDGADYWPASVLAGESSAIMWGGHNRQNAVCAAMATAALGCKDEQILRGLQAFRGLPQRLERLAVVAGRQFINDSAATTPESTIAALRSLDGPLWLLAGGRSKGADLEPLAAEIARRTSGAALFGTIGELLCRQILTHNPQCPAVAINTLDEAFDWCWKHSSPGDTILLSPGAASTDQFLNYRQRGELFVKLVENLTRM